MSGHSKWAQIKHKKGTKDEKRGKLFSKLSMTISIAARDGSDPNANPKLRAAVEKAKASQMPNENIERAIKRVAEAKENLEEIMLEAYGPEGVAIFIEAFTDNRNRLVAEVKSALNEYGAKLGEPGSVRWPSEKEGDGMKAKYTQGLSEESKSKLNELVEVLEDRDDVRRVWTNAI